MDKQRADTAFRITRSTIVLLVVAVIIVCACIGIVLWVLGVSAASVDAAQASGELKLLNSVYYTYQHKLEDHVSDYSNRSELYDNFMRKRDPAWEKENLGPYITRVFETDYLAVVARDGAIAYAYSRAKGSDAVFSRRDAETLVRLARLAAGKAGSETVTAVSGVVEFGGTAGLAAASAIRPTTPSGIYGGARPDYFLVEVRALNPRLLSKIGASFGFHQLAVTRGSGAGMRLAGPADQPTKFALTWAPKKLGRRLYDRMLPAIVLIGALLLVGFVALMAFWWRIVDHIRSHEARALSAEIETTRARAAVAEEMTRNKSAFVANMSHELRTPLNAIIGFSEFMECETLGPINVPKYGEYIKLIKDSGHHLLRIINDILLVSKVEAGKFVLLMENMQIADALHDCLKMMQVVAARRNIRLDTRGCTCSAVVNADRQALRQIFINVLSNAIKFSIDGATVEIECVGPDLAGIVRLRITDHGCGIPPETLRELGKPFVQAEDPYSRKYGGTGIGLAISYRLAAAMGATLDVQSELGTGTAVTILIAGVKAASAAGNEAA